VIELDKTMYVTISGGLISGPNTSTGIYIITSIDWIKVNGVLALFLGKFIDSATGASLGNCFFNEFNTLAYVGDMGLSTSLKLKNVAEATSAGSISKYIIVNVNGTDYKIALYALS
jgi:hypothetical protein